LERGPNRNSWSPRTVPVVTIGFDPIELGLAASYARPGGNVTGVVVLVGEHEAKRLSMFEAVPACRRVAALVPVAKGSE
jgi:putative tryptophan/tyrosine transport system substrate-binding protein